MKKNHAKYSSDELIAVLQQREMLLDIHLLPMAEQKAKVDEIFCSWRGTVEQYDDVLIMGVRF